MTQELVRGPESEVIEDLRTLNEIAATLNRAADVRGALGTALARLIELMGLKTGWVFVREPDKADCWGGRGFRLAAHHNLPPAMALDEEDVWCQDCRCQGLCLKGQLNTAYNEVRCSRLAEARGDRHDLVVHATTPLRSAGNILGILNVAAPAWEAFSPRALALLQNVGNQMGAALERSRLFDMLQEQRIHEQSALLGLSNQLLSQLDLDELTAWLVDKVKRLMDVDACALLLPVDDGESLTFRAATGWRSDPLEHSYQIPADERSKSGQVMRTQRPMWIEDSPEPESRWMADWLDQEEFRSAAIVPLVANGRSIGVLVIHTRKPRHYSEAELRFLQLMANQAALAVERARLHREEIERHRLNEELAVARKIQLSMLPAQCPIAPGWQFASAYEAALEVSGDFFDHFPLPAGPEWLALVIADVAEKGVPAALFMALSRTTIRNSALRGREPADALAVANRFVLEDSGADLFLSAFYAALNLADGTLVYCNAGHNPPLLWRAASGVFEELRTDGIVLGVLREIELDQRITTMSPGDVLMMYTDGVTEAMNAEQEEFGLTRLRQTIAEAVAAGEVNAQSIVDAVREALRSFTAGRPQFDDVTLLVARRDVKEALKGTASE